MVTAEEKQDGKRLKEQSKVAHDPLKIGDRSIRNLLATSVAAALIGCAPQVPAKRHPVYWTSALALNNMSPSPVAIETVDDLATVMAATWDAPFNLQDGRTEKEVISVNNCDALLHVLDTSPDLEPVKAFEFTAYRYRTHLCRAINTLVEAKTSTRSFVRSFMLDAAAPALLPAELAFVVSEEDQELVAKYRDQTLTSLFNNEKRFALENVEVLNLYSMRLADSSDGRQEMKILGYGDFNHDGTEDLLLLVHDYITTASYRAFRLYRLTRHDNGPLTVLPQ